MREVPPVSSTAWRRTAEDYVAALGDGWGLTAAQRIRLTLAAELALSTGWTPVPPVTM